MIIAPHNPARDVEVMRNLAKWGGGEFYYPKNFNKLPQIFIKEAAVVRKALIFEEPFTPEQKHTSAILPGIGPDFPILKGYVGTLQIAHIQRVYRDIPWRSRYSFTTPGLFVQSFAVMSDR